LLINLKPGENSLLKESKKEKIPLRQLLASTIELLIFSCCLKVTFLEERQYRRELLAYLLSKRILIT